MAEEIKAMSDEALRKKLDEMKEEVKRRKEAEVKYECFKTTIEGTLKAAGEPLTWTEIKTKAGLKQKVPNNRWVRMLEKDIGLVREKTKEKGIVWKLG